MTLDPHGEQKKVTVAEVSHNWQTENDVTQNHVLTEIASSTNRMETKMASFSDMDSTIADLKMRIKGLHEQMLYVASIVRDFSATASYFLKTKREHKHLEAQLRSLEQSARPIKPTPVNITNPFGLSTSASEPSAFRELPTTRI